MYGLNAFSSDSNFIIEDKSAVLEIFITVLYILNFPMLDEVTDESLYSTPAARAQRSISAWNLSSDRVFEGSKDFDNSASAASTPGKPAIAAFAVAARRVSSRSLVWQSEFLFESRVNHKAATITVQHTSITLSLGLRDAQKLFIFSAGFIF